MVQTYKETVHFIIVIAGHPNHQIQLNHHKNELFPYHRPEMV